MGRNLGTRAVLVALLLAAGCDGRSAVDDGSPAPTRLAFHVSVAGVDVAGATVTLLDFAGDEVPGFAAVTDDSGFADAVAIDGAPEEGFVARACVPTPGATEEQCLYAVRDGLPRVAAVVALNEVTTLDWHPGFDACTWVLPGGSIPGGSCAAAPLGPHLESDPTLRAGVASAGWSASVVAGLQAAVSPQTLLAAIPGQVLGMGLRQLETVLFPKEDHSQEIIDKIDRLSAMISQIQTQILAQYEDLTRGLNGTVIDNQLPLIRTAIDTLNQADNLLTLKLVTKGTQAELLKSLKNDFLPANTIRDYAEITHARDQIVNYAPGLLGLYPGVDKWHRNKVPTGLYSEQYSNNLYKLYVAMMGALAQAQDLDTRIYHYYMTMVDADGNVCECTETDGKACVGDAGTCRAADGTACSASCTRLTQTLPSIPGLNSGNFDTEDPTRPNPLLPIYDRIYATVRSAFLDAIGHGVPGFLMMQDPEGRTAMFAPYLGAQVTLGILRSPAEIGQLEARLNRDFAVTGRTRREEIPQLFWTKNDPNDPVLADAIEETLVYDDWEVASYVHQYVVNYFLQIDNSSGMDVLTGNGVTVADLAGAANLWAKSSELGQPSIFWAGFPFRDWGGFWRGHLRCFDKLPIYRPVRGCSPANVEVRQLVPNDLSNCGPQSFAWCNQIVRGCASLSGSSQDPGAIPEFAYGPALQFCRIDYTYRVVGLPYFGVCTAEPGDCAALPTTISRSWKSYGVKTRQGIEVSDTTIGTRITPLMWCPNQLAGQAFDSVRIAMAAGLNDQPVAICRYADGSEAVYDALVNGYVRIEDAATVPSAIVSPYNEEAWTMQASCTAADPEVCRFVLVDVGRF